ncbi:MAG: SUMF1/EgtB/PvdO family nonheme iron enzyme [Candidatus Aminicenantes bacterium]|jgi:formylglycine-generating enzyme required for sulfatase activity
MKKGLLKMFILLLMIGSTFPGFSQEKDIKMEVFEKVEEVLPFTAVDNNGHAVTDLDKKEIVLLVNGRNFRGFSLVYPSSHCGQFPVFSNTPKHSCYEITFPYVSEFETFTSIRLGTSRKGVQLHTIKTLKIKAPQTDITGSQKEIPKLKKENKTIPVKIIDVNDQTSLLRPETPGEQPRPSRSSIKITPVTSGAVSLPDTKTGILKRLQNIRLQMTDTAGNVYCEAAIKDLKQNRVKEALFSFEKLLTRGGIQADIESFLLQLIKKIQHIDQTSKEMLNKVSGFSKKVKSISWDKIDIHLEKGKIGRALSYLQELLYNRQEQIDRARETLDQLPIILEIHQSPAFKSDKHRTLFSLEQKSRYCREQLELFRAFQPQLEDKIFIQAGRIKKILAHLEKILSRDTQQMEMIKQRLQDIQDMNNKQYGEEVINFVTANSEKFSADYRDPFFKARLERPGVAKELIAQPSFFDVVTHSQGIYKNPQGYWEAVFTTSDARPLNGRGDRPLFDKGITMIYIPRGEFTMGIPWESGGAEDESPQHQVMLDGYWISKYEITFDQYDQFCQETGRNKPIDYGRGRKKRPIIGISWEDCQAFCQWLSRKTGLHFRLPTEAEWEKAARGTDARKYPWGDDPPGGDQANFADVKFLKKYLELNPPKNKTERKQKTGWIDPSIDDGYAFTAPVGSFPGSASPYGVMDMAGNVWEWVLDWYDGDYYQRSPVNNPLQTSSGTYRVSRGGGWDCHPWLLRTTSRAGCFPSRGNDALGFRVVCMYAFGDQGGSFRENRPPGPPAKAFD